LLAWFMVHASCLFFNSLFVPIPVLALRAHGLDTLHPGKPCIAAPETFPLFNHRL
jgi:hypothetical protein